MRRASNQQAQTPPPWLETTFCRPAPVRRRPSTLKNTRCETRGHGQASPQAEAQDVLPGKSAHRVRYIRLQAEGQCPPPGAQTAQRHNRIEGRTPTGDAINASGQNSRTIRPKRRGSRRQRRRCGDSHIVDTHDRHPHVTRFAVGRHRPKHLIADRTVEHQTPQKGARRNRIILLGPQLCYGHTPWH